MPGRPPWSAWSVPCSMSTRRGGRAAPPSSSTCERPALPLRSTSRRTCPAADNARPATVVRADASRFDPDPDDVDEFATVPSRPPGPARERGAHRLQPRSRRRALAVGALVLAVAGAAVLGGLWWARGDQVAPSSAVATSATSPAGTAAEASTAAVPPTALPSSSATGPSVRSSTPSPAPVGTTVDAVGSAPVDWLATVAALDAMRADALRTRDPSILDDVYLPGAPAKDVDEKVIAGLVDRGLLVDDARHSVSSARRLADRGLFIRIEVRRRPALLPGHRRVRPRGRADHRAGRGAADLRTPFENVGRVPDLGHHSAVSRRRQTAGDPTTPRRAALRPDCRWYLLALGG